MDVLRVDCDRCIARGPACGDCVITVLLEPPADLVNLDSDDRAALAALADQGLVPPLRLIPAVRSANPTSSLGWQNYA